MLEKVIRRKIELDKYASKNDVLITYKTKFRGLEI